MPTPEDYAKILENLQADYEPPGPKFTYLLYALVLAVVGIMAWMEVDSWVIALVVIVALIKFLLIRHDGKKNRPSSRESDRKDQS